MSVRFAIKLSRAVFGWPPKPAATEVKQLLVKQSAKRNGIQNLIETGTFKGEMVEAQRENFRTIVTIELQESLCEAAKKRFEQFSHIHVLHGDSSRMLPEAMRMIEGPTVFWLDAHYSKGTTARGVSETPILNELSLIAKRGQDGDVILIDDARHFGLHPGYPRMAKIRKFVLENWPSYSFKVETDIIRIEPQLPAR